MGHQQVCERRHEGGEPDGRSGGTPARRGFLSAMVALASGGIATMAPLGAGIWAFLDPLGRRSAAASFLPVTRLESIPDDGVPRQFPVIADRVDAWTGFAAEPVGAVYLRRGKDSTAVEALSATCPHAGCFVELEPGAACFRCPCHSSSFTFDGGIVAPSPSPRAMDSLECRVTQAGAVEVKWRKFRAGVADKVEQ